MRVPVRGEKPVRSECLRMSNIAYKTASQGFSGSEGVGKRVLAHRCIWLIMFRRKGPSTIPKAGASFKLPLLSKKGCNTPIKNFSWSEKISTKACKEITIFKHMHHTRTVCQGETGGGFIAASQMNNMCLQNKLYWHGSCREHQLNRSSASVFTKGDLTL